MMAGKHRFPVIDVGWAQIQLHDSDSITISTRYYKGAPVPPHVLSNATGDHITISRGGRRVPLDLLVSSEQTLSDHEGQDSSQVTAFAAEARGEAREFERDPAQMSHEEFFGRRHFADINSVNPTEWWALFTAFYPEHRLRTLRENGNSISPPPHDLNMPHHAGYEDWRSCPPNCPHLIWAVVEDLVTGNPPWMNQQHVEPSEPSAEPDKPVV